jgi:hypothetical protein
MTDWGSGSWGSGQWGLTPSEIPPPKLAAVGNWGTTPWGCSAYGGAVGVDPPFVGAVGPAICDVKGGTVLGVFGDNFVDPTRIEIIDMGGLETIGEAYYFEARLDLRKTKILAGFPPADAGTYGIRITTPAGVTPVLPDAVTYQAFAEQGKVHRVRRRWAPFWATGERLLT